MTWVKLFSDSDCEVGSDENIDKGLVSWTRGRQDINGVILSDDLAKHSACLVVDECNEWWQFDRLKAAIQSGVCKPIKTAVVVQAKISEKMVDQVVWATTHKTSIAKTTTSISLEDQSTIVGYNYGDVLYTISSNQIGKWITVVLPRGAPPKILITDKGKFK